VSRVTNMTYVFKGASSFTRTLCGAWSTSTAKQEGIFEGSSGKICGNAINPDGTLQKFPTPHPDHDYTLAASKDEVEKLRGLSSVELRKVDSWGNTLLIWAADSGSVSTVQFLLQHDSSNVNHRGYLGNTAISRAARGGHAKCVELLLAVETIDCDIPNDKRQYPLHFAAFKKQRQCVQAMICSNKCDYAVKDRKGRMPAEDTLDEDIRTMLLRAAAGKDPGQICAKRLRPSEPQAGPAQHKLRRFTPNSKEELKAAVEECRLLPTDCSKGPSGRPGTS